MEHIGTNIKQISSKKYLCEICDYTTERKSNIQNHLKSAKHLREINSQLFKQISSSKYKCNHCGKKYQTYSGLWKHKNTCKIIDETDDETDEKPIDQTKLIIQLLKQNQELQKSLIELSKEKTITNNTNNSHNKTFNLHVFLNETCKDAMNIGEFVSSIKVELSDLETTGRVGYAEGVSKIILKNLKCLNQHDRPIHCSDPKREILYIKTDDEWFKETDDKPILTKAIKCIANENIKQINEFKKLYPDCSASDSKKNDLYLKIVSNAMSGSTKEESNKNINKIISNVVRSVVIDKND